MTTYISDMELNTNHNGRYVTTLTLLYHATSLKQNEQQSYLHTVAIKSRLEDEDAINMVSGDRFEVRGDILKDFIDKFDIDLKLMNDEYILDDNIYLVEFDT